MTYSETLEKLETATGTDKSLNRAIMCGLGGWHRVLTPGRTGRKRVGYISPDDWIGAYSDGSPMLDSMNGTTIYNDVPDVTGCVTAAIELVKHVLPGSRWTIGSANTATVIPQGQHTLYSAESTTPALAILTAVVRAIAAKEAGE